MSTQGKPRQDGSKEHRAKLILVGEAGVGKSSIERRSVEGSFEERQPTTLKCCFSIKRVAVENKTIKLDIWDTAGQERFCRLARSYFRGAHVAIVVYDITSEKTYNKALDSIQEVRENCNDTTEVVLVGNKVDLAETSRAVRTEDVSSYASENEILFAETSAKTGVGIEELFLKIAQRLAKKFEEGVISDGNRDGVMVNGEEEKKGWGYCCY